MSVLNVPAELLEIVACPKCHGGLATDDDLGGFVCHACSLLFEVKDGIPDFVIDEASPLDGDAAS